MSNTIKTTLEAIGLVEWQRVSVRRKTKNNIEYLGGGIVSNITRRFGDRTIIKSQFSDGILVIYVD